MKRWLAYLALCSLLLAPCFSCTTTRTIFVPDGTPVRLAEPTRAYVYVLVGGEWVKSENRLTIPEGWYALPDPGK